MITATWVVAPLAIGLIASWIFLGRPVFEKLATNCVMPLGLIAIALTVLCVHAGRERRLRKSALLIVTWAICFLAGNGMVADCITTALEDRYANIDPLETEPLDYIVVLGGATRETNVGGVQVSESGDRIVMTARMYHRGLIKQIYCTGARIEGLSTDKRDSAEQARQLLVDLGVPRDAIRRLGGRNTAEEMASIAKTVGDTPVGRA